MAKIYISDQYLDKDSVSEVFEPGFLFGWGDVGVDGDSVD